MLREGRCQYQQLAPHAPPTFFCCGFRLYVSTRHGHADNSPLDHKVVRIARPLVSLVHDPSSATWLGRDAIPRCCAERRANRETS